MSKNCEIILNGNHKEWIKDVVPLREVYPTYV